MIDDCYSLGKYNIDHPFNLIHSIAITIYRCRKRYRIFTTKIFKQCIFAVYYSKA